VFSRLYLLFNKDFPATRGDSLLDIDLCEVALRLGNTLAARWERERGDIGAACGSLPGHVIPPRAHGRTRFPVIVTSTPGTLHLTIVARDVDLTMKLVRWLLRR
jgi:hypothetical protein